MALLHLLRQQIGAERLLVTHCNFHLRGDESMRDQHFCEALCREWNLPLVIQHFDTRSYMQQEHLSLELAARRLRYEWWEELAQQKEAETSLPVRIAVGHHRDDSIETVLMNLMRGTGIRGLVGIPEQNGRIIRPLSRLSRADILQYLERHQLSYITDSSNLENEATRNQIRNLLLPLMEQINPNVREGISHTMQHLSQTQKLAEAQLNGLFASTTRHRAAGVEWYEWTLPQHITDEAEMATLFHHWQERYPNAVRHRRLFYTAIPNEQILPELHLSLPDPTPSAVPCERFDADRVQLPLTIRHWQEGDRIQPLGMTGTKLVSDLFSNAHLSPNSKATTWIVADATGRLLWVVGLRVAEWSKITDSTTRILHIPLNAFSSYNNAQ